MYDGDRVIIVVPCSKRYPIHNTQIDYFHGFVDDGENYPARAQCFYEGDDAAPPGLDDEEYWFDFELVSLARPGWLCRRISRIQLLWCSYHLPHSAALVKLRVAFYRRCLAETTLTLIGSFLMEGPTTARVALRLTGMTYGWPYDTAVRYRRTARVVSAGGRTI